MNKTPYGYEVTTELSVGDAETAIRAALADRGFGILTEIDVAATFAAKLGIERDAYKILGACNPNLANRAIAADDNIGLLLPCNVVIATIDGKTRVSVVNPHSMLGVAADSSDLEAVATEANEQLVAALNAVG